MAVRCARMAEEDHSMAVEVGEMAPDFELKDQHGSPVTLSGLRGKNVVLVF